MRQIMHGLPLDKQDIRILELLQENSRLPRLELAERANLSSSQCFRRIKRMEDAGLIEGYGIRVNKEKAGIDVSACVMVQFNKFEEEGRLKTIDLLNRLDVVQSSFSITGEYDFLINVHCASMKEFSTLINKDLQVSYISGVHSYILLECFKSDKALHLKPTTD